jgi:hypothetical protein
MNAKFFVPFETAKLLKWKGYPQDKSDYGYFDNGDSHPLIMFPADNFDSAAPTYHEVVDWLETEKDILVSVDTDEVNSYLSSAYYRYRSGTLCHSEWVSSREGALNEVIIKILERL